MNLYKLYDIAEKENIKIYDWHIENSYGAFVNIDKINVIALNYNNLGTYIDEKCTLAEELGHYYCDATYSFYCTNTFYISKQEYKAKKWAFKTLIPCSKIKELTNKGYKYAFEFAEELGVTENLFNLAVNYYKENNMLEEHNAISSLC